MARVSDGSDAVYHMDQSGNTIGPYVETPASRSTPVVPDLRADATLRVSPNGARRVLQRVLLRQRGLVLRRPVERQFHDDQRGLRGVNWLDDGHILITHIGDTFGNAAFAEYGIGVPGLAHGGWDDPPCFPISIWPPRRGPRTASRSTRTTR